ncbi:glycosyltransferase family 4 protein [Mariniflexile ostreae]|uniref:Glycosyltransferase family 4 protein n=1 Tax=Mariniflexile ostreae TaxID=1520892 RepID=A0ABV5FEP1_9FLAO
MNKHLLVIGFVWPEPKSSAAGSRMMQLLLAFQAQEYHITFASPCAKSENAFNLEDIGITQASITLNDYSFDEFIKKLDPSVVLFDRFMMEEQFGWRVAAQCPNAFRVLDTEDLHSLRKGRHQAFKDKKNFDDAYLFNDTAKREIASIYRCDLSLIISEAEMALLINRFKIDKSLLFYLPFMLDRIPEHAIAQLPKFKERQNFISIGNFLHEPNYNAVLYLKDRIWPLLRKQLPKVSLNIYGAYASQKVNQLHNEKDGFLIKGFADNAHKVMQEAKVCLAPIRFGAGLKGKLVDAMQNGTPSVTTNIGAEGLYGHTEPNGFIEDNTEEFVNKAVLLYQNETLWNTCRDYGFKTVNKRFDKISLQKQLFNRITEISQHLKTHRTHNFIGQMLQHHTMQSTKFMSKWIEAKNADYKK